MSKSNAPDNFQLWYYNPSVPAAVIACIIFGTLTLYHAFRLIRTRAWFCIPFVIGGLFEIIGYAARAVAHDKLHDKNPYIIQSLLLLIAPPLFAASIYMILGRIMRVTGAEHYSIVRVNWVTKIFVTSDVTCFLVQGSGGGIMASGGANSFKLGESITLAGLILQIVIFCFFVVVAAIFHSRLRKQPTAVSIQGSISWERLMWILYGVSGLITLRNVVRAAEYGMGHGNYLQANEWTLYVFDGLPMAVVLLICVTWYRDDIKPRRKNVDGHSLEEQNFRPKARI